MVGRHNGGLELGGGGIAAFVLTASLAAGAAVIPLPQFQHCVQRNTLVELYLQRSQQLERAALLRCEHSFSGLG